MRDFGLVIKEIFMSMCILGMIKAKVLRKGQKERKERKYDVIWVRWGGSFLFSYFFIC